MAGADLDSGCAGEGDGMVPVDDDRPAVGAAAVREIDHRIGIGSGLDDEPIAGTCRRQCLAELSRRDALSGGSGSCVVMACRHDISVEKDLRRDEGIAGVGSQANGIAAAGAVDRSRDAAV